MSMYINGTNIFINKHINSLVGPHRKRSGLTRNVSNAFARRGQTNVASS